MDETIARKLVELNSDFYERMAESFSATRLGFQPGFERLSAYVTVSARVLDVGCGNGRFARFLAERVGPVDYTGVDFSEQLLQTAAGLPGHYIRRDLTQLGCLSDLGEFQVITCLSTLQHIPGQAIRERLLREMGERLAPGGCILMCNWQFLDSPRQRRKVRPWAEAGIRSEQVEPDDYLLSWERGGSGLRYVACIDFSATVALCESAGLRVTDSFRSDGREGNLNLYTVLAG
ncbi:MAG TPA: methyltransferase domain-containing protein [Promineifilum sp.]|nr:methyltransferase domain-containing protein [Promineifilum sp.]